MNPTTASDSAVPVNSTVLRMRGLPYTVTEEEVKNFFKNASASGESPTAIVIINQGFHRGEGFVRFASSEECTAAHAKMNRQVIGTRYIELYPSTEAAMQVAAQQQHEIGEQTNLIVRLRGLPFQATEQNIKEFFGTLADSIAGVQMCTSYDGRATGGAFVEVTTPEAQLAALEKNRQMMGQRYVEVFASTPHERDVLLTSARRGVRRNNNTHGGRGNGASPVPGAGAPGAYGAPSGFAVPAPASAQAGGYGRGGGGGRGGYGMNGGGHHGAHAGHHQAGAYGAHGHGAAHGHGGHAHAHAAHTAHAAPAPAAAAGGQRPPSSYVIRVRGLPYQANEAQVAEFFSDVNIPTQGVHMVYNAQEKPTGEAFVEVIAETDVMTALRHNGAAMGHRYVEVFRSSSTDMNRLGSAAPFEQNPGPAPAAYAAMPVSYAPVPSQYALPQQPFVPSYGHASQAMLPAFIPPQAAGYGAAHHGAAAHGAGGAHGGPASGGYNWASDLPTQFQQHPHHAPHHAAGTR